MELICWYERRIYKTERVWYGSAIDVGHIGCELYWVLRRYIHGVTISQRIEFDQICSPLELCCCFASNDHNNKLLKVETKT